MIVVADASVGIQVALNRQSAAVLEAETVIVPDLYLVEVTNAAWQYLNFSELSRGEVEELLEIALQLPDEIVASSELCLDAFALASAAKHPVYDMMYVALARRNAIPLATADRKLKRLAKKHGIEVV